MSSTDTELIFRLAVAYKRWTGEPDMESVIARMASDLAALAEEYNVALGVAA